MSRLGTQAVSSHEHTHTYTHIHTHTHTSYDRFGRRAAGSDDGDVGASRCGADDSLALALALPGGWPLDSSPPYL